jgi:hypothetical protein
MLDRLQDETTQQETLPGLEQIAPGYADWIITAPFGGTYLRDGLSLRDRQLINLAALADAGHTHQILLGADTVTSTALSSADGPGMPFLLSGLRPRSSPRTRPAPSRCDGDSHDRLQL